MSATWVPTDGDHELPPEETPVVVMLRGQLRVAERRWDHPGFEDTYKSYWYWDCPYHDGQDWGQEDVTHWLRDLPEVAADSQG